MRYFFVLSLLLFPTLIHSESVFYKYKDASGQTVMDDTLPGDVVERGYTVVNGSGKVVQVVPAAKTQDQMRLEGLQKELQDRETQREEKIRAEQSKMDNLIRQSFESMDDIVRSENEQLNAADTVINMTVIQIDRLNEKLKALESQRSAYELKHSQIPDNLKQSIAEAALALKENSSFLKKKQDERSEIKAYYRSLKERYILLQKTTTKEPRP